MGPRKRKGASEGGDTTTFKRVTRSQTRGDVKEKVVQVKKKTKIVKPKTTPKSEVEEVVTGVDDNGVVDDDADVDIKVNDAALHNPKTIVIEHCTQCVSFKKRAVMVKEGLMDAVPALTVLLNPIKPRRGCFEIREEGGEPFVSLLNMKRPFGPMKELVMEDVIASIVDKIKE